MSLVLFVRHGESESNYIIHQNGLNSDTVNEINSHEDPELTLLGRKQAWTTACYLKSRLLTYDNVKVTVWVSPFTRTKQTAQPFLDSANDIISNVEYIPLLQEYTDLDKQLSQEMKDLGLIHHETWSAFTENVIQLNTLIKQKIMSMNKNEHLVIFGHSISISTLVSYHSTSEQFMITVPGVVHLPNCSITCSLYDGVEWNIFVIGSVGHLLHKLVTGTHVPFADGHL